MTRKTGQVSFNLRSAYESRLYEHANKTEHGEFSKYVKRLIDRDMSGSTPPASAEYKTETDVDVSVFL